MMRIKSMVVVTEDLEELVFEGPGTLVITDTYVPGKTIKENQPVRYATATVNLPVS